MLNKKPFTLLLRILPFVMLLLISGYFTYGAWHKYQTNMHLKHALSHITILQNYEESKLDEALCLLLTSKDNNQSQHLCQERKEDAQTYLKLLKAEDVNLGSWVHKIGIDEKKLNDESMAHFGAFIHKQKVTSGLHSYFETISCQKSMLKEKALLEVYQKVVDASYATALENFLLTYYVSKKIEISAANLIYWDSVIEASALPVLDDAHYVETLNRRIHTLVDEKEFSALSNKIDDMHISILTGGMTQNAKNIGWIVLLEKKQKKLKEIQSLIEKALNTALETRISSALNTLLFFCVAILFGIIGLFLLYRDYKSKRREAQSLADMMGKLNALSSYGTAESEVMTEMLSRAKSKEEIYAHIYSRFQLLEEKRKQAKDEASSKSQFLSTLSHEIRTPLNGIIGFSKLLKDMGVTADQEEFLALIEGSSNNLIAIVNDVLDLSKMNAAKMEIENVSFDIFETIETTIAPFVYRTDQKDIELGLFIDPFLAQNFCGDATKLSQVLTNLVGNAMKFTDDYGKIDVFVQCIHDRRDEAEIKFAVHDNGIGLSEEQIHNIFEAFTQATKSTSKKYGGTGLGLTISSKMVELMGGKLEVESQVDKGASFFFTLTLKKDMQKATPEYLDFSEKTIGLALPVKNIKRQLDTNLEIYIRHLGAEFTYYYYDDIFAEDASVQLPNLMIFDHHYARLSGELQQCASIQCKTVLLTNGTLRSRINPDRHKFDDVLLTPISLRKSLRILQNTLKETEPERIQTKILKDHESFSGLTALVADDNMINRKLIKIILEKIGLGVTLTNDGHEVFEAYKKGGFDIILMDIQMPVMDGVEATHAILAYELEHEQKHIPIIAITANVGTHDKEHYLAEGMDDYMTKPVEIETLKKMITKHCEGVSEDMLKSDA